MSTEAQVDRLRSTIATLQAKVADQAMKSSKANQDVSRARQRAARASSPTMAASRLRDADRYQKAAQTAEKRRADLERQLATKMKALASAEARLTRERSSQFRALDTLQRRVAPFERQFRPTAEVGLGAASMIDDGDATHDVFISYASEDREEIARPLASRLDALGLSVWFDEFSLAVGDSLRRRIDDGLAGSRFGVVVLSPDFFRKGWTQAELDGLVARERAHGHKVILPIWHRVTRDDVLAASPSLADKVALNSSVMTLEQIADSIAAVVRPHAADNQHTTAARALQHDLESHLDEVRAAVTRNGGAAVAVFGSVARGDAHPGSDIDFLVDFEDGRTLGDLARLKSDLEALLGRSVDVVSVGGLRGRDEEIPADAVWL